MSCSFISFLITAKSSEVRPVLGQPFKGWNKVEHIVSRALLGSLPKSTLGTLFLAFTLTMCSKKTSSVLPITYKFTFVTLEGVVEVQSCLGLKLSSAVAIAVVRSRIMMSKRVFTVLSTLELPNLYFFHAS